MGKPVGKPRILFLDIHNDALSQMAEALLRKLAGERFLPFSAGLEPTQVDPLVSTVLEEIQVSAEGHQAKGLIEFWSGKHTFSYTITVGTESKNKRPAIFPFKSQHLSWLVSSPELTVANTSERLDALRRNRDELIQQIQNWLPTAEDHPKVLRPF